jgi:hypothetical protein
MFPTTGILDDFNRANQGPPPSASWANFRPNGLIVQNQAVTGATQQVENKDHWAATPAADQEVYITIASIPDPNAGEYFEVLGRLDPVAYTGYSVYGGFVGVDGVMQIIRYDDEFNWTALATYLGLPKFTKIGLQIIGDVLSAWYYFGGAWVLAGSVTDNTYTGGKIGLLISASNTFPVGEDFGGGSYAPCTPLTSATITHAVAHKLVCVDNIFNVAYAPVNATPPVTYLWSTDGLQSGQGTPTAIYNWTVTCAHTVTCTVSNCGGAVVSNSVIVNADLTLIQIAQAIKNTFESHMTAPYLARAYGYNQLPEGINDAPALLVYWNSIENDHYTDTDRTTFHATRVKALSFNVDYIVNPRNNLAENNSMITSGANEIINILEQESLGCAADGGHCPPFGLCGLKGFRWEGRLAMLDYGAVTYYGARFVITLRVF